MKNSTISNQWSYTTDYDSTHAAKSRRCSMLWLTFLLLVMTIVVPRQVYAGAHFGTDYGSNSNYNSRITHHPTVDEPWITVYFWFYDSDGRDGYFLHDQTENGHDGPAVYIDGKYICSPDWELSWAANNGNSDALEDERNEDEWWGNTYTRNVDGVNYTVRFWDPRRKNGKQYWVDMVIYMDKMIVATEHDIKIRGKWKINNTSTEWEERTFRTIAIPDIFSYSSKYERTYGSLRVKSSTLYRNNGPTTVAMTTDSSYYENYGKGKRYFAPSTMNKAVYETYSKGASSYNGLTLSYDEQGGSIDLYTQKSITVTPNGRPSTILFGWVKNTIRDYDEAHDVVATTDMWKNKYY